jgi:hypothetical protein
MIDTKSLHPYRNKLIHYDEEKGLLLDLNNYIYRFLNQPIVSYLWNDFGESLHTKLYMRPLQDKDTLSCNDIFTILAKIYEAGDLPNLFAYIELLYDSLAKAEEIPIFKQLINSYNAEINQILTIHNTGFSLVSGLVIEGLDVISKNDLEIALEKDDKASSHIRRALEAILARSTQNADLCIRESINSLEFILKDKLPVKTFDEGIKYLKQHKLLHGALINSSEKIFESLINFYGYTSDTVRHSGPASENLTLEEAHLALSLSVAWINFFRKALSKINNHGGI